MSIPFTQFMRLDGRRKSVSIERPAEVEEIARKCMEVGCRFEIEMLSNGIISMESMLEEDSVACELCVNDGSDVCAKVDKLVHETWRKLIEPAVLEEDEV